MTEAHRLLAPSGILGVSSWESVPWPDDCRAALADHPTPPPFPSNEGFLRMFNAEGPAWATVSGVRAAFEKAGFKDVEVKEYERSVQLEGVEEIVQMLGPMVGMVLSKCWCKDDFERRRDEAVRVCENYARGKYGEGRAEWNGWRGIVGTGRKGSGSESLDG